MHRSRAEKIILAEKSKNDEKTYRGKIIFSYKLLVSVSILIILLVKYIDGHY